MAERKAEVELIFDASGKGIRAIRLASGELVELADKGEKAEKKTKNLDSGFKKLALSIGSMIAAGAVLRKTFDFLSESVEKAGVQQIAERKLEQALKNLGIESTETQQRLKRLASEVQSFSNFGDESIITAQAMLLSFASVAGPQGVELLTPRLADLAAGVAKTTGETIDLSAAATAMGKALGGTGAELREYGISLTAAQQEAFKTAEGLDKVRLVTEILDDNFQGLAKATANAGVQMSNAIGDFQEAIASDLLPEIEKTQRQITGFLSDPRTLELASRIGSALVEFGQGIVRFFQFSIPIASARLRASFLETASTIVNKSGEVVNAILHPIDAIRGVARANPFHDLILQMDGLAAVSRSVEEELINQELNLSAARIQAEFFAEANRDLASSEQELIDVVTGGTGDPKQPIMLQAISVTDEARRIFIENEKKRLRIHASLRKVDVQAFENEERRKAEAIKMRERAHEAALAQSIQTNIGEISTAREGANAILGSIRQVIQAKVAETIAKAIATIPFPFNLVAGGFAAVAINALFDRLLPKFADGVTNFSGGVALVGERGPELVNLPNGSNVITNENTQAILGRLDERLASDSGDTQSSRIAEAVNDQTGALLSGLNELGERMTVIEARIDPFIFNESMDKHNALERAVGNTAR